jgi:S-adenosylmethionine:tRNA ribosyltransferase-isomerase
MKTSEFDFDLPESLIAQHPVEPRDHSRLMVLDRAAGRWEHSRFDRLPDRLARGDLLVRNNSRVVPARLIGARVATGGRWEGVFLRTVDCGAIWEILSKTRGRLKPGERVRVGEGLELELIERSSDGAWLVRPDSTLDVVSLLELHGRLPLPPYIRKGQEGPGDRERYQTVFAREAGSVAAPTAGLHFTSELMARLAEGGIETVDSTLHVGVGTFRPIEAEEIEEHRIHAEHAELSATAAERLNAARARGSRIVAVGTTSARTLETASSNGRFESFRGETSTYILPGREIVGFDALITNFHLPRSSLLVLVSAFAGREFVLEAYREAVREGYRFYSYGDAMLIV